MTLCGPKKKSETQTQQSKGLHWGKRGDGKDGIWSWYLIFHTASVISINQHEHFSGQIAFDCNPPLTPPCHFLSSLSVSCVCLIRTTPLIPLFLQSNFPVRTHYSTQSVCLSLRRPRRSSVCRMKVISSEFKDLRWTIVCLSIAASRTVWENLVLYLVAILTLSNRHQHSNICKTNGSDSLGHAEFNLQFMSHYISQHFDKTYFSNSSFGFAPQIWVRSSSGHVGQILIKV